MNAICHADIKLGASRNHLCVVMCLYYVNTRWPNKLRTVWRSIGKCRVTCYPGLKFKILWRHLRQYKFFLKVFSINKSFFADCIICWVYMYCQLHYILVDRKFHINTIDRPRVPSSAYGPGWNMKSTRPVYCIVIKST